MNSKFDRISHFNRLGVSAGIGALAILTGACSESAGTDSDVVPASTGASETAGEAGAASTDGENSTDMQAPAAVAEESVSTDSDEAVPTDGGETAE